MLFLPPHWEKQYIQHVCEDVTMWFSGSDFQMLYMCEMGDITRENKDFACIWRVKKSRRHMMFSDMLNKNHIIPERDIFGMFHL